MNPITNKTVAKTVATSLEREQGEIQKTEPSKFDKVRTEQLQKSSSVPCDLPSPVTDVSAAQRQALQAQLSQRVDNSYSQPGNILKVDMQNTKTTLNRLRPPTSRKSWNDTSSLSAATASATIRRTSS